MIRMLNWLVAGGIATISCMLIAQVFFRYVLNSSLSWTEEVGTFLLIWVGVLGVASGLRSEDFIAFTLFRRSRIAAVRLLCTIISWPSTIAFSGLIAFYGWNLSFDRAYGPVSAAASIPLAWIYAIFPIGGVLIAALSIARFVRELSGKAQQTPDADSGKDI